jgi:threonine/homoserine/homoserine lactone efflux protein
VVTHLGAFLGVSALVIVTPGQDTLLTVRNALLGGRRAGILTALGVSSGQAIWAIAASAGLAALLSASEPAFLVIRVVGAAYLVLLGCQALSHAARPKSLEDEAGAGPALGVRSTVAFRHGLLSNLGNPKMAVFFTSLLPQFTVGGQASFMSLLALGLVFSCLTLLWLTGYAVAVAKAGHVLRRPAVRRAIDAVAGVALVAFGVRLATEHR